MFASRRAAPAPSRRVASTSSAPPAVQSGAPVVQSRGPGFGGMMMQGAALGAGAAVGSSMVHGAMNMVGGKKEDHGQPSTSPAAYQEPAPISEMPCSSELKQFMSCAQSASNDLNMCTAFNDIYRQCKGQLGG